METIQINGIELAYLRRGRGRPLTLLHGYPLDHHIWDAVVPLLENTFDLIVPDLRGFGKSATVTTTYTLDDFADDLAGLLDHLKVEQTALAGHSMGGYVALAFANRYHGRVNGLGMVSSQALADPPERKEGRYKTAQDVAENGIAGVVAVMTPKLTPDRQIQQLISEVMARQQPAAYIGALKAMAERIDASAWLASVQFPVVLVHGDADDLIPVARAREIKEMLPPAHLVELNGVGHLPMLEAPQQTAEALRTLR